MRTKSKKSMGSSFEAGGGGVCNAYTRWKRACAGNLSYL